MLSTQEDMMSRFVLRVALASSILFSTNAFALQESAKHAKVREFACGNDPYQHAWMR
jgi:hypothetical protein